MKRHLRTALKTSVEGQHISNDSILKGQQENTQGKGKFVKTCIVHKLASPAEHLDLLACGRQREEEAEVLSKAPRNNT